TARSSAGSRDGVCQVGVTPETAAVTGGYSIPRPRTPTVGLHFEPGSIKAPAACSPTHPGEAHQMSRFVCLGWGEVEVPVPEAADGVGDVRRHRGQINRLDPVAF